MKGIYIMIFCNFFLNFSVVGKYFMRPFISCVFINLVQWSDRVSRTNWSGELQDWSLQSVT